MALAEPGKSGGGALGALARFAVRRPGWTLAAAACLTAACIALAAARLELLTSNLDLVDPDLPTVAAFRSFAERFGTPNLLVVVLEGHDEGPLRQAADRVAAVVAGGPGVESVFARLPYDAGSLARLGIEPYLVSRDRGLYFVFVQPDDPDSGAATLAPFVEGVRRAVGGLGLEASGVRWGLTGLPQYALDDRDTIRRDISRLSFVGLGLILLLFTAAFGSLRRPLLAAVALLVGVAATLGVAAVFPAHLTLVSAFFASILFGLGIDFGIHIVDRVEELLGEGRSLREAVPEAIAALSRGLAAGALTTAGAFFTMLASGFRGFAELGWIAGAGILLCLLAMVTVLPALLVLAPPGKVRLSPRSQGRLGRLLVTLGSRPVALLLLAAAGAVLVTGAPPFDGDYTRLQPRGSEAVRLEEEMVRRSAFSPHFAAFVTASPEAAAELARRLAADPTVGQVHSIADLTLLDAVAPADPAGRAALLARYASADGRYAVYAWPDGDVWDPAFEATFLDHMRALDPAVTGMPVLGRFMIDRSHRALWTTALLGSLAVLLLVLLDFRHPVWALLAVAPTFLGGATLLAAMKVLGLAFNPLNVLALTVVLGIGVDDGVHLVHRFLAEGGDVAATLRGTGRSVVLTSLTSLAAFGCLAFTAHRGLSSFAIVLSLGVTLALLHSVLVLPVLLRAARRRVSQPRHLRRDSAPCPEPASLA